MKKVTTLIFTLFMIVGSSFVSGASSTPDVNAQLIEAIQKNSLDDVLAVLDKGADANYCLEFYAGSYKSALGLAVQYGNSNIIQALLDRGADIHKKDYPDNPPLCNAENYEVTKVLLDYGADVNTMCKPSFASKHFEGPTLLHRSVSEGGNLAIAKLLIQKGANVNLVGSFWPYLNLRLAPLHVAAENGSLEGVRLLLDNGALVDIQDNNGNTPLHRAMMRYAHTDNDLNLIFNIVRLLVARGADINAKNKFNETPLHLASKNNLSDVARFLLQQGGSV